MRCSGKLVQNTFSLINSTLEMWFFSDTFFHIHTVPRIHRKLLGTNTQPSAVGPKAVAMFPLKGVVNSGAHTVQNQGSAGFRRQNNTFVEEVCTVAAASVVFGFVRVAM